jgi:flavin-dependent dehydrogenase
LVRAGCDVAILDKARFPREKVCAGWITPAVVHALELDLVDYSRDRTLQPFTGFRTGTFDGGLLLTDFGRAISYGIRRCEFDDYLLRRSGARLILDEPLREVRRAGNDWVVNDVVRAPVIVGAGGHFCPIAKRVNPGATRDAAVVAQEIEYRLDGSNGGGCQVQKEWPELFFWPDLRGYGWCVRKGDYLNIGAGHLSRSEFPLRVRQFAAMVQGRGAVSGSVPGPWKGHAYLLNRTSSRRVHERGVLLAGDAAGLALAPSGEGILAAVESGQMAADAILSAAPSFERDRLAPYADQIESRFGPRGRTNLLTRVPGWLTVVTARAMLASPWLTRRILMEGAFLHMGRAPYAGRASSVSGSSRLSF